MADGVEKYNKRGVKTSYISTIIGISLVLFVIGLVISGVFGLDRLQKQAKESLVCDIFFQADLNEADIKQVAQELNTWDQFKEVEFVSPERAIETFQDGEQNADNILDLYDGINPMPPTISFKPKEAYANKEKLEIIKSELMEAYGDRIEVVSYDKESVESVNLGFKQFVLLIGAVSILLIVVAFAMINNTIRLSLYSKRFSIKTMQLVGATSGYIRRPFLWASVGMGIVSGSIGMALVLGLFFALNNVMDSVDVQMDIMSFIILFSSLVVIGVVISIVSTWFALNKFLRMKLDDLY